MNALVPWTLAVFFHSRPARVRDIQGNAGLASRGNSRFRREAKGWIDGPATADLHVKDGKQQLLWAIGKYSVCLFSLA